MEIIVCVLLVFFISLMIYSILERVRIASIIGISHIEGLSNNDTVSKSQSSAETADELKEKHKLLTAKARSQNLMKKINDYDVVVSNISNYLDELNHKVECATKKTSSLTSGRKEQSADLKQKKQAKVNKVKDIMSVFPK